MDMNNLTKSNTMVYEGYAIAQMEGHKIRFFRISQPTIMNTFLTLTDNIENSILYPCISDALEDIEYFRSEVKKDNFYTLSDTIDLDSLFLMKVKETKTIEYELSEVK